MRFWPFSRAEHRQAILHRHAYQPAVSASGRRGRQGGSDRGRWKHAAGIVGRAFAAAEVDGPEGYVECLTPACNPWSYRQAAYSGRWGDLRH